VLEQLRRIYSIVRRILSCSHFQESWASVC